MGNVLKTLLDITMLIQKKIGKQEMNQCQTIIATPKYGHY